MRTTRFYLFILLSMLLYSCSEKEYEPCTLSIQVTFPEDYKTLPLNEVKVTLTNKEQGNTYTSGCSPEGIATFQVEGGYYTAAVHYQTSSGLIFSGRIESLSALPGQSEITADLPLTRTQTNALVIKEIYYGGCPGTEGEGYQTDQYVTIYNNSGTTVYLDGLCLAVVDPPFSQQSPWMKYTDMARIPINEVTWQFPGSGKEYPLTPGAETTIATNAVDHTGGDYKQINSVDLSKVDWGFWDVSFSKQNITPGVKPMKLISNFNPKLLMYSFPPVGPTLMLFGMENTDVETYISDPANKEARPQSSNPNKYYLMIPRGWVIDCVECVENINQVPFKRVPDILDSGAAYIPNNPYTGKSLIRKSSVDATGRLVYQDTNNSTNDMVVSTPTLKK